MEKNSALVIASVTTALKNLLNNGLIHELSGMNAGEVTVSTLPPDRIAGGAEERAQLNLYLYRVTPNSSWRRASVGGGTSHEGGTSHAATFLALDLHYLLTAYGERDIEAEVLLGYAIQLLYETPILTREALRTAFVLTAPKYASGAISTTALDNQPEQIKISTEFLSMEEMSKLWSSLQTRSRLSVTYEVATVLVEDRRGRQ
jgi:hypothetical protein